MSAIKGVVQKLLSRSDCIQKLYSACISKEDAMKELNGFVPRISNFVDKYVGDLGHKMVPPVPDEKNKDVNDVEKWNGTICAIHDVEENIWVPELGIKGKVDVTVEVKINRYKKNLTKVSKLMG
jgi:DNA replication ATP-dependent helicase Dna2